MTILAEKPAKAFQSFLDDVQAMGISRALIEEGANANISYYAGRVKEAPCLQQQDRWYESLRVAEEQPDFSIYEEDIYLSELWACWKLYSRPYLREIERHGILKDRGPIRRVLDLGCGFGLSTAALTQMFPDAEVIGTNVGESAQTRLAKVNASRYGFTLRESAEGVGPVDVAFASEYFEHFQRPLEHLGDLLQSAPPRIWLIAAPFGSLNAGHFHRYRILDPYESWKWYDGSTTAALFRCMLRENGYAKVKTKLWNNTPSLWVRGLGSPQEAVVSS
jgi:SAM-dependent methyltransferase